MSMHIMHSVGIAPERYFTSIMLLFVILSVISCSQNAASISVSRSYQEVDLVLTVHIVPATWFNAALHCQLEGGVLASPTTSALVQVMLTAIAEYKLSSGVFIGVTDLLSRGDFKSLNGVPIATIPLEWAAGEPNNADNSERCLALTAAGALADINCYGVLPYFCGQDDSLFLLSSPAVPQPLFSSHHTPGASTIATPLPTTPLTTIPLPTTPLTTIPLPTTPLPPTRTPFASPKTTSRPITPLPTTPLTTIPLPTTPLTTNPLLTTPLTTTPLTTTPLPTTPLPTTPLPTTPLPTTPLPPTRTPFASPKATSRPTTPLPTTPLTTIPLPTTPLSTTPLPPTRTPFASPKTTSRPTTHLPTTPLPTTPVQCPFGYEWEPRTSSCYKFHWKPKKYLKALFDCFAEGGSLAVINSMTESTVLKEIFDKNMPFIPANVEKRFAFIGILKKTVYDWFVRHTNVQNSDYDEQDLGAEHNDEWVAIVVGRPVQSLIEAGFAKWSSEPNTETGMESCGAIAQADGLLKSVRCGVALPYICEFNPPHTRSKI